MPEERCASVSSLPARSICSSGPAFGRRGAEPPGGTPARQVGAVHDRRARTPMRPHQRVGFERRTFHKARGARSVWRARQSDMAMPVARLKSRRIDAVST